MESVIQPATSAPANRSGGTFKAWLPILFFGVLWADMIRQLSFQWEANEQYAYGWFVPFLSLALFWKRWITRPAAQSTSSPFSLSALMALFALSFLPVRVVHEINPDWPLCNWVLTLLVVGLSLYAVFLAGGWPWVKHFAFPVCFILIAVRWPYRIEHNLTQGLMRVVASLTVEILGWFNLPAFQRGNLIELSTGVVGIDEACSGIRSFQSTLMAALFLGELYFLKWPRRAVLLVGGVALAFCFNVVRTLILTWQASTAGLHALEKWHDPAGMTIFLISFACLWGIAAWLRTKGGEASRSPSGPQPSILHSQPALRRYLFALGCWAICVIALTEVWYRAHEPKQAGIFHWSATFPTNNTAFQAIQLSEQTRKILRHDSGGAAKWTEADGGDWSAYFFRWNPTSVGAVIAAGLHRPDVCLPAAGLQQVADEGVEYFEAGQLKLPFRKYTYQSAQQIIHVFFCQWEDGSDRQEGLAGSKQAGRVRLALAGKKRAGQQTFEIILSGYQSSADAAAAVRKRLPELIRVEAPVLSAAR